MNNMRFSRIHSETPPEVMRHLDGIFDSEKFHKFQRKMADTATNLINRLNRNQITLEEADNQVYKLSGMRFFSRDTVAHRVTDSAAQTGSVPLYAPNIGYPVQFFQQWLPGLVGQILTIRMADLAFGERMIGDWIDEEVVQKYMEGYAMPTLFSDADNKSDTNLNIIFEPLDVVRFEQGVGANDKAQADAARMQVDLMASKRNVARTAMDVVSNEIAWYGANTSVNRTYGALNHPSLLPTQPFPAGAGGQTEWQTKTFEEITADIRNMATTLRVQSGGNYQAGKQPSTLLIALSVYETLKTMNAISNYSVQQYIDDLYPKTTILGVPEFDQAEGGENVAMWFVNKNMKDLTSTDSGAVWSHEKQVKFMLRGMKKEAFRTEEIYLMAENGMRLTRPTAVTKWVGC